MQRHRPAGRAALSRGRWCCLLLQLLRGRRLHGGAQGLQQLGRQAAAPTAALAASSRPSRRAGAGGLERRGRDACWGGGWWGGQRLGGRAGALQKAGWAGRWCDRAVDPQADGVIEQDICISAQLAQRKATQAHCSAPTCKPKLPKAWRIRCWSKGEVARASPSTAAGTSWCGEAGALLAAATAEGEPLPPPLPGDSAAGAAAVARKLAAVCAACGTAAAARWGGSVTCGRKVRQQVC